MTYAVAMKLNSGLAFMADTRVNAGLDNVSTSKKIHSWYRDGAYNLTLMAAGNLGTSQVARGRFRELIASNDFLKSHRSVFHAATALGTIIGDVTLERMKAEPEYSEMFRISAILGGQFFGSEPQLFLIYPEGNFIEATEDTPFLAIGEHKYGRPILAARYNASFDEDQAYDVLMKSMEVTARNNLSVGPPIDFSFYEADSFSAGKERRTDDFDPSNSIMFELSGGRSADIPNPSLRASENKDVFAMLRELKVATDNLSNYIRSLNDPELATPHVRATRAYIDAFQEFLDLEGANRPDTIPGEIVVATEKSIRRVDWTLLSEQANKWAKTILDIIKIVGG